MDPNNPNYGNRVNSQNFPNFSENTMSPNFSNVQTNPNNNLPFDPNLLNNPHFLMVAQSFSNQNPSRPTSFNYQQLPPNSQYSPSFPMSQHFEQHPSTPEGDGSSNRTPTQEFGLSQINPNDEEDTEEDEDEVQLSQGKNIGKIAKERWSIKEDEALYLHT